MARNGRLVRRAFPNRDRPARHRTGARRAPIGGAPAYVGCRLAGERAPRARVPPCGKTTEIYFFIRRLISLAYFSTCVRVLMRSAAVDACLRCAARSEGRVATQC